MIKSLFLLVLLFCRFHESTAAVLESEQEILHQINLLQKQLKIAEEQKDWKKIEECLTLVLKYCNRLKNGNPNKTAIQYGASSRMGVAKFYLKKYQESIYYLEQALSFNIEENENILNHKLDMQTGLASAYTILGNREKALFYFNQAKQRIVILEKSADRYKPHILERLYFFYTARSDFFESVRQYDKALHALCHIKTFFEQAKAENDLLYPMIIYKTGRIHYASGKWDVAADCFSQALDVFISENKFPEQSFLYLIRTLEKSGNPEKAFQVSQRYLNSVTHFPAGEKRKKYLAIILFCMGKICDLQGNGKEAEQYKKKAAELGSPSFLKQSYQSVL